MHAPASSEYDGFKKMEWDGWQERAPHYHDRLGQVTKRATVYLLDAVDARPGMRLVDICCGPGHATREAAARGLEVVGVDFAPMMISEAQRMFPELEFRIGEAEALDFPNTTFDAAICGLGLLHLPEPERALAEAFRVLRSGGAYAFSVWCTPDKAKLLSVLLNAVMAHADTTVPLPSAPSFFQFSDPTFSVAVLERAGFRNATMREITLGRELIKGEATAAS